MCTRLPPAKRSRSAPPATAKTLEKHVSLLRGAPPNAENQPQTERTMERAEKMMTDRARRAQARAAAQSMDRESEMTCLEAASVRLEVTRKHYRETWKEFKDWARKTQRKIANDVDLDSAAARYVEMLFVSSETGVAAGNFLLASIQWHRPQLQAMGRKSLPRLRRALRGWRNLEPSQTRLPLSWEIIAAIVNWMLLQGHREVALLLWLAFEMYCRPGELLKVRVVDLVPPLPRASSAHKFWAVTLHAREAGSMSKMGEFDECLRLDLPRQTGLGAALRLMLAERLGPSAGVKMTSSDIPRPWSAAPLFTVKLPLVRSLVVKAAAALRFEGLPRIQLYQWRHAGPSHDFACGARDLEEIRRRGRWKTWASVRRYEKGARVTEMMHRLLPASREHAVKCAEQLSLIVSGQRFPLTPPGA